MKDVEEIYKKALKAFQEATSSQALYEAKVSFLGKKGELSKLMRGMKNLSAEERPAFGQKMNEVKNQLEKHYELKQKSFRKKDLELKLEKEYWDLSLPGVSRTQGSLHPLSLVMHEMVEILSRLGFTVKEGPLIEKDWYNFEALNIPPDHPSRDMQDTFYVETERKENFVLRTQTSPVQIHTMEKEKPPLRILSPGPVFRCDSDVTHSPNFFQIEGLWVDKKVSMSDLKGVVGYFARAFFNEKTRIRFRPSFFPFTEPSAEVDCSCPICKEKGCRVCSYSGWIEIAGSGLVHPKVFESVNLDPEKWQGFAFGFGVERMAMIKYGIDDIRLFNENDVRFLGQFV